MKKMLIFLAIFLILYFFNISISIAQKITADNYIEFVPLSRPQIITQTRANRAFNLFGDKKDTNSYRDENKDGIDDIRYNRLKFISTRFSPVLIKNTGYSIPMDFKAIINKDVMPLLYIDTWELSQAKKKIIERETINFAFLDTSSGIDSSYKIRKIKDIRKCEDCQLLALLKEFHPDSSTNPKIQPHTKKFKVLYFDMPGEDEQSWKKEYQSEISKTLKEKYAHSLKVYAHPFIHEETTSINESRRYEFVIQYWLFYPFNDGGNNHEGDWEHINVIIAMKDNINALLTKEDIKQILEIQSSSTVDSQLVIKRVEYYFHHYVMILDYTHPNVYLNYEKWKAELDSMPRERRLEKEKWRLIRKRAILDSGEIDTHPIGYIGGDNKGLDQILSAPGGKNRDSHGTYPFAGHYKGIGPVGATEKINGNLDCHQDIKDSKEFVHFDSVQIVLVPDWERVIDLALNHSDVRRTWSWLILPIRWGFPAVESPGAGVLKNVDTGNLSSIGPAYNSAWNRVGACDGYDLFDPHAFSANYPLGWQDKFINSWGYLNLTLPTLISIPPLDLIPYKLIFESSNRVFMCTESIPFRRIGFAVGLNPSFGNNDFAHLLPMGENEYIQKIIMKDSLHYYIHSLENFNTFSYNNLGIQINTFLGSRFATENLIRYSKSKVRYKLINIAKQTEVVQGDLVMWEYAGSFRYNLLISRFQPFIKLGYGYSVYQVKNVKIDDTPIPNIKNEWYHNPTFPWLPNTWHFGLGIEILPLISSGPNLSKYPWPISWSGIDQGIKLEYGLFFHNLGNDAAENTFITRHQIGLSITLSY